MIKIPLRLSLLFKYPAINFFCVWEYLKSKFRNLHFYWTSLCSDIMLFYYDDFFQFSCRELFFRIKFIECTLNKRNIFMLNWQNVSCMHGKAQWIRIIYDILHYQLKKTQQMFCTQNFVIDINIYFRSFNLFLQFILLVQIEREKRKIMNQQIPLRILRAKNVFRCY